jgi:hypothetical protein
METTVRYDIELQVEMILRNDIDFELEQAGNTTVEMFTELPFLLMLSTLRDISDIAVAKMTHSVPLLVNTSTVAVQTASCFE